MDFDELLKPAVQPNDDRVIETIKKSGAPVVMYGVSVDVADQIAKKLLENGISVQLVVFDEETPVMTTATRLLNNLPTVHVGAVDSMLSAYHVIPGFVKAYSRMAEIAVKFRNVLSAGYLSEIFEMEIITPSFILENEAILRDFYNCLADQHSKDSFVAYLLGKTRQDMKYLPPVFEKRQYFPQNMFELSDNESYFDCGAYTGDTVSDFLKATHGAYRRIWAAEPDFSNYSSLMQYIENANLKDIDAVQKGVYNYAGKLPFKEDGTMLSMITENSNRTIEVDTIDHMTAGAPVTYIKMDVEGVELQALQGAEQTIRNCKPILGISIYHKERDLIDIPAYIRRIVPEYSFYFRVHKKLAIDTVLYGIVLE